MATGKPAGELRDPSLFFTRRSGVRQEEGSNFLEQGRRAIQVSRPISTGTLKPLRALHPQPINLVVF